MVIRKDANGFCKQTKPAEAQLYHTVWKPFKNSRFYRNITIRLFWGGFQTACFYQNNRGLYGLGDANHEAHVAKNNERRSQLICNIATLASVGLKKRKKALFSSFVFFVFFSSEADEISAPWIRNCKNFFPFLLLSVLWVLSSKILYCVHFGMCMHAMRALISAQAEAEVCKLLNYLAASPAGHPQMASCVYRHAIWFPFDIFSL